MTPTPNKVVVSLSNGTLTEAVYPSTGGQAPNWTFSGTPSSTRVLLTDVGPGQTGDPPADAPLFRYFKYDGGVVDPNSLPTPLSAEDAVLAVRVDVAFSVSPLSNPTRDDLADVTVTDSVLVRFSPASEDPTKVNGPCV